MTRWNERSEERLGAITQRLKRRRVELFVRACKLGPEDLVLDLGSEGGSYLASYYPFPKNIVLADTLEAPIKGGVERYGLHSYAVIPAEGSLPFPDRAFAAVWCNSVIEHVTIPRPKLATASERVFRADADVHQRAFAREIARVGRQYFVQTPYLHFPIEAHSWLPLLQYLPQPTRWRCSRLMKRVWVKQWTADFHLFDLHRFRSHFPDATQILFERVLGLPKALIAVRTAK